MQNRREFEPQHLSPIADPTPESRRASEVQVKTSDHRLTFINSVQGVRRLSAENAAKHRHAIFTGVSPKFLFISASRTTS